MYEALEGFPVAVGFDTAKLEDCLSALLDPAHAAVIAAPADDVLDRAFNDARRDGEVAPP